MVQFYRVTLSLTVTAFLFFSCGSDAKKSSGPAEGRNILTVEGQVMVLSTLDFSNVYTGKLMANEEIDIRPEISAKVTGINFKEGSTVSKGTMLVKMFDSDLQANLKSNPCPVFLNTSILFAEEPCRFLFLFLLLTEFQWLNYISS